VVDIIYSIDAVEVVERSRETHSEYIAVVRSMRGGHTILCQRWRDAASVDVGLARPSANGLGDPPASISVCGDRYPVIHVLHAIHVMSCTENRHASTKAAFGTISTFDTSLSMLFVMRQLYSG
jgi:hypothetical protein